MVSILSCCGKRAPTLLMLVLLASLSGCGGRTVLFEDEPRTAWQEGGLQLPAYPAEADLIPLDVSSSTSTAFFIDGKSLSLGEDGVVRYTLVGRAAGGAENVSFEGMRCETAERKLYALGRAKGEWVLSRNDQWQRIADNAFNRQHAVLAKEFFCPPGSILPAREQILQSLRQAAGPGGALRKPEP